MPHVGRQLGASYNGIIPSNQGWIGLIGYFPIVIVVVWLVGLFQIDASYVLKHLGVLGYYLKECGSNTVVLLLQVLITI